MARKLKVITMPLLECSECGNEEFIINGWEVTEDLLDDEYYEQAYNVHDVGDVEIIEVMCTECEEHYISTTGTKL